MLIITSTDKIQVTTTAVTTNAMDCFASYRDVTTSAYTPARNGTVTNGVTAVDLVASPAAATQRVIDYLSVFNRDTALKTVTITFYNGSTSYILWQGDVGVGGKVEYQEGVGFTYIPYAPQGYAINVQALTSSPVDGQTVYFGCLPKAPVTVSGQSKIYIRKPGILKVAEIYCFSGTAGDAIAWSLYVSKNGNTDYLIATVNASANERVFSNSSLSVSLLAGDWLEIKGVNPTWPTTNPATTIYGGYLYIE